LPSAISITSDPYQGIQQATSAPNIKNNSQSGVLAQKSGSAGEDIEQPRGMPSWMLTPDALASKNAKPAETPIPSGAARIASTLQHAESIVAKDGVSAAANFLHNPKNAALVAGGAAAIAGAQLVPGVGEAVDLAAGVAGVAMYAAAGPEHRARITQAVGELRSYLGDVSSARSQGDLDRASGHLARFMELGGTEASQGLLAIAGAASAPARFTELAKDVASSGGLAGIARLASGGSGAFQELGAKVNGFVNDVGVRLGNGGLTPAYAGGSARIAEMRSVEAPRGGSVGATRGNFDLDELSGGHAKSMHIGKSDDWLRGRLEKNPRMKAASTFTSEAGANKAVGAFLKNHRQTIEKWAGNPKAEDALNMTVPTDSPIGRVLTRGADEPRTSSTFFIQIIKDNSSRGWHINTAYPK
jgi:hypothetical protein